MFRGPCATGLLFDHDGGINEPIGFIVFLERLLLEEDLEAGLWREGNLPGSKFNFHRLLVDFLEESRSGLITNPKCRTPE